MMIDPWESHFPSRWAGRPIPSVVHAGEAVLTPGQQHVVESTGTAHNVAPAFTDSEIYEIYAAGSAAARRDGSWYVSRDVVEQICARHGGRWAVGELHLFGLPVRIIAGEGVLYLQERRRPQCARRRMRLQ